MKELLLFTLLMALPCWGATVKTVCASGCDYSDVQSAVIAASYGWVIEVRAGETFSGEVQLKRKTGTPAYITIRSSAIRELPGGVRVTVAGVSSMPKLQHSGPVITTEKGASYYRLEGLEIAPETGRFLYSLLALYPQTATGQIDVHELADQPHHIIIDRCYIHGLPAEDGPRVAVYLETGYTEVVNSWIGEIKDANGEAKAILSISGAGPMVIRNNHLEAAAITTLVGGADSMIPGTRASDLAFLGNHYYRPWKWRFQDVTADPTGTCMWDARGGEFQHNTSNSTYWQCQGGAWTAILAGAYPAITSYWQKNHFELKNASRVQIEGNLIENAWLPAAQGQKGAAFLFNQVGYYVAGGNYDNHATIKYAVLENNRITNTPWSVSAGGNGVVGYTERIHDIDIRNNLFTGQGGEPFSNGDSSFAQSSQQTDEIRYTNNTIIDASSASGYGLVFQMNASEPGDFSYGMGFSGNIVGFRYSGWRDFGKGNSATKNALDSQWDYPSRAMSKNVVLDNLNRRAEGYWTSMDLASASENPPYSGTLQCPSCALGTPDGGPWYWENGGNHDVGFVDFSGHNYRLKSTSPYKRWSHMGQDAGADIDVVEWSTEHAADGAANPYLDFRVRAATPGRTSASLRFTAYDLNSCMVTVSDRTDLATTAFELTDGGGSRDRLVEVAGLSANTRYFYRVVCNGTYRRGGVFTTTP